MTGLTRRGILGASAAALAPVPTIAAAVPSAHPDAELIAVCAEFIACDKQQRAVYDGPGAIDDDDDAAAATAPIFARMNELLDRMQALRAQTAVGIAARAASLAQHTGHWGFSFDYRDTTPGRLLDYLMRDAAALGGNVPAVQPVPHADAELIALCSKFDALERRYLSNGNEDERDGELEAIVEGQNALLPRISELPPSTHEGAIALARSLALWDAELFKTTLDDYTNEVLVVTLVRGLVGSVGQPS